jgi:hypothetical protein
VCARPGWSSFLFDRSFFSCENAVICSSESGTESNVWRSLACAVRCSLFRVFRSILRFDFAREEEKTVGNAASIAICGRFCSFKTRQFCCFAAAILREEEETGSNAPFAPAANR